MMEKILFISSSTQDKKTWILTIILGILPVMFFGWKMFNDPFSGFYHRAISFILFLLLIVIGFLFTPHKYVLTTTHLIIKRYWRDISIPLASIQEIQQIEKKTIWRSFGYAGPFGYFGIFSSSRNGKLYVLARRYNNWTLVASDRKKYVIAPDDLQLIEATAQQICQTETDSQSTQSRPSKRWLIIINAATFLAVISLLYLSYIDTKVEFEATAFKLNGIYGIHIPFTEIADVDTIAQHMMPAISKRTNGVSLFKVHRGHFKTTKGDKIRLSMSGKESPIIRIVEKNGKTYFINRKNLDETRQIFDEIKTGISRTK